MPARALDHLVLRTRDLSDLAETYRRLGFTVGRRNRHPWGTVNHIVQFDGVFLELLGFAEDYATLPPDDPAYPFAGFLERAADGVAMLVLRSQDAARDAQTFAQSGIGRGRLLPFSRSAQGPDGSDRTVAFTVAFAELPSMPEVGFFTCQQHRPENFWNPDAQRHANGTLGLAAVLFVADDPTAHTDGFRSLSEQPEVSKVNGRLAIRLDGSRIEISTPGAWKSRFEAEPPVQAGAAVAGVVFRVADLASTHHYFEAEGIPVVRREDSLVVPAPFAGAVTLIFSDGNAASSTTGTEGADQPRPR